VNVNAAAPAPDDQAGQVYGQVQGRRRLVMSRVVTEPSSRRARRLAGVVAVGPIAALLMVAASPASGQVFQERPAGAEPGHASYLAHVAAAAAHLRLHETAAGARGA
jgi:hypothetical protein